MQKNEIVRVKSRLEILACQFGDGFESAVRGNRYLINGHFNTEALLDEAADVLQRVLQADHE